MMPNSLFLLGLVLLARAAGAAEAPLPIERFFQQPAVLEAKLSPSGKQVALSTARGSKRVSLVIISLGATPTARSVANFDDADVVSFDWVGEERLVFSLADLQYGSREVYERAPGLYAVDADGARFIQLIRRSGAPLVADGMKRHEALAANHHLLHVPTQQEGVKPDEVIIGAAEFRGRDYVGSMPMWLNTRSGSTRSMQLTGAPGSAVWWAFDSRGEARAALTRADNSTALLWRGAGETSWRKLTESSLLEPAFEPVGVSDDGKLFVTHPVGPEGWEVLTQFDFASRAPAAQAVLSTPGFDFRGSLVQGEPGAAPLGVRVDTDAEMTQWFDQPMQRLQALVDERLPGSVNRIDCRRCGKPDQVVLVRSFSDTDPGRLLLYEAASKRWQTLASIMDGITPRQMATVDFQRIKARDGHDLPVWLTLPNAQTTGVPGGQPAPAVVLVHGGPWVRIGHWQWQAMEQFLASRGYLVISPEFRGSSGYGKSHFRAGWQQWGQSMQDDVADALLWAQAKGLASQQACIAGASYGGYSALMGLVRHPDLYRCGIAWAAVTDPFLFLTGEAWVSDDISRSARLHGLRTLVGDPEKDAAMLTAVSPLAQAARIRAPLLLAFGEKDKRVPLAHGLRIRDALKAAGHPPEWVSYPDEAHGWRELSAQIDFARRVEAFLAKHIGSAKP